MCVCVCWEEDNKRLTSSVKSRASARLACWNARESISVLTASASFEIRNGEIEIKSLCVVGVADFFTFEFQFTMLEFSFSLFRSLKTRARSPRLQF